MDRKDLENILRSDFANNIRPMVIQEHCEKCGSSYNLIVHHNTRFCELVDKTLSDLHIETSNYSESQVKIIKNYILGLQLKTKLITLCNDCHTQLHIDLGGYGVDRNKRVSNCSLKILNYIENKISEGKWKQIKSKELMEELNIKGSNWNKIWNNEYFIEIMKEKRIRQSSRKAGGKQGNRKVNWIIKY